MRLRLCKAPLVFVFLLIAGLFLVPSSIFGSTSTISTESDFNSGIFSNTESYSSLGNLKLKDAGSWSSVYTAATPLTQSQGYSAQSDGTYIYFLWQNDTYFGRYNPADNKWKQLANAPYSTSVYRSEMVNLNGYLYVLVGGYQKKFLRYKIVNNTWETLGDIPDYTLYGASIETDGTYIYLLRSTNTTDFWRYDPSTNVWSTKAATPGTMYTGSDLVYSGGYLYTPRGNNTTTFYRYDIAGNSWTSMTVAPGTLNGDHDILANGDYIYVTRSTGTNTFYRYSISGNSWTTLNNLPQVVNYHSFVYVSSLSRYYLFRGNGTYDIWIYNIGSDSFSYYNDPPTTFGAGLDMLHYGGEIYMPRGAGTQTYWKFNIASNTWTALTNTPIGFNTEQKGTVAGTYLYYFSGAGTGFYRYDPAGNSWTTLTVAPAAVASGVSAVYPGSGDYIYASRGNNTTSFWRYSISGNSWDDPAVADLPTNMLMSIGSRLITDGTDVYALTGGNGKPRLYKYTVASNTWSDLGMLPFMTMWGTDAVYYNGKIYAQAGHYRSDFWEYNISSPSWRRLENLSSIFAQDIGPYQGGSLVSNGSGTLYSTWGTNFSRLQSYSINANKYVSSGTWTSGTVDLSYVSSFTSLTSTTTTPGASTITYETRTSSDTSTWSSWQSVSGTTIQSSANRYIQVRATLTSDTGGVDTPVLQDITITYATDTTAPTNPTTFTGSSQQISGTSITTGNTYTYAHPYFTWSGASDANSTIAGYYVSFTTSSSADPQSVGSLVSSASYLVTESLTNGQTYYLRLKTVDSVGNISSATTGFQYVYNGVSPTTSTFTSDADFSGTVTSTVVQNNQIKLASDSGGIWQQERLSLSPAGLGAGANFAYVSSSGKLYTMRGQNTQTFYEYDIATDTWSTKANTPAAASYGWITEGPSGYLYGARGNSTSDFWRYDIVGNTWSSMTGAPLALSGGSKGIYDGTRYIYVTRGLSDDAFYRYDTQTDAWDSLANAQFEVLNAVYQGASMTFDGSDTIYVAQGGGFAGFSSYSISGNSWTILPTLPYVGNNDIGLEYVSSENALYYLIGNTRVAFFKYNISSETWTQLADVPGSVGQGGDIQHVNGKLYAIRGGNTQVVYTYTISTGAWKVPTVGLFGGIFRYSDYLTFVNGAEIVKGDGNYYYVTRGNYDTLFVRYDASTGAVTRMSDAPSGFYNGADLEYDSVNGKIYAIAKTSDTGFYQYDIATNTWTDITTDPLTAAPSTGGNLEFDGSRYIYFIRGGSTTTLYRYDTQATAGTRWSTMAVSPAGIDSGSDMVYKNGNIYTARGASQATFYRYNVGANNWTTLTVVPATVGGDGFMVDGGDSDSLVLCRGLNTSTCYKYSLYGNSWTTVDTAPANITTGGGAAVSASKMYAIAGAGTNTYADGLYTYILQTGSSSYALTGSYESQAHDLASVYKFGNLSVTYTPASSGTTMTPYTRSSADGSTWSTWTAAANKRTNGSISTYEIKSADNRYLQVRFDFTSGDGLYSDVIDDYTISYYTDSSAPTNPTSLLSYSTATQSATITTNTWYNHSGPNFDWPDAEAVGGATDGSGGSGIAGYYVYFGTSSSADASESGTLQTATSYTASSLTSGQTYYLRIKAVDDAGNTAATSWQPFIYKYDSTVPTNPSSVSASPPGYSTSSVFTFTWTAGSDSDSNISSYCYKTGQTGATETCTSDTIATASAYTTGSNTFNVRAKDTAGNFASSYLNTAYYYTGGAPGAPTNLTPSPSTNTQNAFTFTWDAPEVDGDESDIMYYYSVNALPTANNVTQVGRTRVLPSDAYATQKGANIMYIVAQYPSTYTIAEDPDSIDFNNYASVTFTADTSAPGTPSNLDIADVSIKSTSAWRLALSWNAPSASGSGVASYKVYRSATEDASCTTGISNFTQVATTAEASYVNIGLTQQTYYYCVKACDSTNNCSSASSTVSLYPDGKWESSPDLTASPSAAVKTRSATITWSTSRTANSFVKYGKTSGNYGEEVGSSEQVTSHSVALKELDPGTTYYYKTIWTDEDGNQGQSSEITFTTNAAPLVSEVKVTDVSISSAYVSATIKNATTASLEYGLSTTYGSSESIPVSKAGGTYSVQLTNLDEDTEYFVRISASDEEGNTYKGEAHKFQTLPVPKIENLKIQQITGLPTAALRLIWASNTPVSTIVTYYPTEFPEQAKDKISLTMKSKHEVIINDLKDETEYTILVKGKDVVGNEAKADSKKVKTAADLRAPDILDLTVESTIVGVGDGAKAQIIVCWDTDEPATTRVEYGVGTGGTFSSSTQEDTSLISNHCATITGASPSQIYQVRPISKDKAGNIGKSFDTIVVTPSATKDALNLVIENLSNAFGFLKRLSK